MEDFAAIDVSLELSSVCVVDGGGRIVSERKVASEPGALVALFRDLGLAFARIGLEAGPLSQWLHGGLTAEGFPAVLIETRHVKAALKAMTVKTDRNDARSMAQLMRGISSGARKGAAGARNACLAHWSASVTGQAARY